MISTYKTKLAVLSLLTNHHTEHGVNGDWGKGSRS